MSEAPLHNVAALLLNKVATESATRGPLDCSLPALLHKTKACEKLMSSLIKELRILVHLAKLQTLVNTDEQLEWRYFRNQECF